MVAQFGAPAQEGKLHEKRQADNDATCLEHNIGGSSSRATGGKHIIHHQHPVARMDGVGVDLDGVGPVLQRVLDPPPLPRQLALFAGRNQARPKGGISYTVETPFGLSVGTTFVYDLKLSGDFTPRAHDGEVAEFLLLPAHEVLEMAATTAEALHFKPNSALVIIDFLLRHGLLGNDSPGLAEVKTALHALRS